mgnify:CR=1 FL=1
MADIAYLKKIRNQNLESKDVILPNDKKWPEKISNYKSEKNLYTFNTSHYPGHVSHKFIKEEENAFNPITQKFTDNNHEKSIRQFDKINKINDISKGYDRELCMESTYNIINLRNKLKGLNYSEDKYLNNKRQNVSTDKFNNKPYNIISNNSFKVQHYLPPNMRDKIPDLGNCTEGIIPIKNKRDYLNDKYYKDYDIISNKYKFFNKEKEQAEKEIQTLAAAKKIQNLRTYDIIKRRFINPEIEENYQKALEQKQKAKIDNAIKDKIKNKNYIIRNPINNEVFDETAQKEQDQKEFEKLGKYRMKSRIEDYYRSLDVNKDKNTENRFKTLNKPSEHKIVNDRGYNIVNNTLFNQESRSNKFKKYKILSDWEKLKLFSDEENSTFDKKTIYKSMYDKSDVNENYKNFLIKRKQKLKELNPLSQDPVFKISFENDKNRNTSPFAKTFNSCSKTRSNTVESGARKGRNNIIYKFNNSMNKKNFYETNRNINDYDNKDSRPVLVDRNVNTRYFKNYITKLKKK